MNRTRKPRRGRAAAFSMDGQNGAAGRAVRFELDARAERQSAALRIAAACVAWLAGAWLFALPYALPRLLGAAGCVFALLRLVRARRDRKRLPAEHYLELGADAL